MSLGNFDHIYHIVPKSHWKEAQKRGNYQPLSLQQEGFIHASTREQVFRVANRFYCDQKDLLLLCLDPQKVQAEIRWEAPIHPQLVTDAENWTEEKFPHIYGALNVDAVIKVIPLSRDEEGYFQNLIE